MAGALAAASAAISALSKGLGDDPDRGWTQLLTARARYSDEYATLYEYCADARSRKEIAAKFDDAPWVEAALEEFVEKDLMIHLDNRYLSLALPENPYF